ncbi:MAG: HDOD domain-containing protein [Burkholderiales bacterium]|nr:HDOD domain-containing protein [Burkholderiales bacterium]
MNNFGQARSTAAKDWLDDNGDKLPGFNFSFTQTVGKIAWDKIAYDELAKVIDTNLSCVARVLQIANSPFFGLNKRVASVRDALTVLGMASARNVITSGCLLESVGATEDNHLIADVVTHSVIAGSVAKMIASTFNAGEGHAFTAGLLHDVGKLTLLVRAPQEANGLYKATEQMTDKQMMYSEVGLFGFDHAELATEMLHRWRLPMEIVDAVASYHQYESLKEPLQRVVCIADCMAQYVQHTHADRAEAAATKRSHLDALDVPGSLIDGVCERVVRELGKQLSYSGENP